MEAKLEQQQQAQCVEDSYSEPHLTPLTAPSTTSSTLLDMSAYSHNNTTTTSAAAVTSSFLELHPPGGQPPPPPHYYTDFEWQHHGAVPDTARGSFYGFPADRPDLTPAVQLYHSAFSGGVAHHHPTTADLYTSSPALWHHPAAAPPNLVDDPTNPHSAAALASQRYLPSLSRTSGSSSSSSSSSSTSTTNPGKPKRRRVQSVTQRKAANVRERRRMFHLNTAFDELRKRLPAFNYEKRLSRIETLRLAMTYIGFMKDVTMGEDPRKVKLRPGCHSDAGSDLSHVDMESCTSEDAQQEDVEC